MSDEPRANQRITHHASRITFYVLRFRFLAAALAIAFAAALPLLAGPGLLNTRGGGDSPFLLQRLQQLETAVLQGHFPVRWMPDANYGYGYPFFNYYAPLSIYITFLFRLIGFSYVNSIQLSQLAGFFVAAAGMFYLARRWFKSDWAGLLAAAAYTVAPFHMVNIYTRGDSLAEFWAMAFYPLVILAADSVAGGKWRRVALLALAYAGLILSHNISAMIFSPFLLLYIFLRWLRRPAAGRHSSFIIHHFAALLLAFALSAWFFVPALMEQSLAQLGPVTEGYFHFSNHFRGVDLVQWRFFFDYNPDGGVAFRMGLVQAVTAVLGLIIWARERRGKGAGEPGRFVIVSFIIATFMITSLAQPLWEHLPLLSFTQFPWRFLSVQAFFGAVAAGGIALLPWRKWITSGTAVLILIAGLGQLQTDHLALTDADVTAVNLAQYEWFTGNIGTTISAEYLPQTVQPRPYTSAWLETGERDAVRALSGELVNAQRVNEQMTHQIWELETVVSTETAVSSETAVPTTLIFPTLHWPGWVGELDGNEVAIRPSPGSGLIMLDVPAGAHTLTLRLTRTPVRFWTELLSFAALLVTIWLLRPARFSKPRRSHALIFISVSALIIILYRWPQRTLSADDLTWDFAQMGYLHHDESIPFSNGAVLTSYTITPEEAVAGETVTITLNWQADVDTNATIALATPANLRQLQAGLLVEQTQLIKTGAVMYQLTIPENAPLGLVVPRLLLDNGRALMPSGKTRGELYLRPLRITPSSVIRHPSSVATLEARVTHVELKGGVLGVQMAWFTPHVLSQNYNVSLRLLDRDGAVASQFDTQSGYGFLPSSGWPANEWINDWLTVPIPILDNGPYALVAYLYDVETGEVVLTRRLGELDKSLVFAIQEPDFVLPDEMSGETAVFTANATPIIQLAGYTRDANSLTLHWQSLSETETNYTRFVHLIDPTTDEIIAQVDGYPVGNSYPTSQWQPNEIINDTIFDLPPGEYEIMVGFYENLGDRWPRLTAVAPDGSPYPDDRVPLKN